MLGGSGTCLSTWGIFRQYLFSQDREELPFNRAQRSWVYRAAKNIDSGSVWLHPSAEPAGDFIFLNGLFPPLEEEVEARRPICFGRAMPGQPPTTSFFNISAMSFGALSAPAIPRCRAVRNWRVSG